MCHENELTLLHDAVCCPRRAARPVSNGVLAAPTGFASLGGSLFRGLTTPAMDLSTLRALLNRTRLTSSIRRSGSKNATAVLLASRPRSLWFRLGFVFPVCHWFPVVVSQDPNRAALTLGPSQIRTCPFLASGSQISLGIAQANGWPHCVVLDPRGGVRAERTTWCNPELPLQEKYCDTAELSPKVRHRVRSVPNLNRVKS